MGRYCDWKVMYLSSTYHQTRKNDRARVDKGINVGGDMAKKDGGGIQQAAGLIRYFDEESEDSWKISPRQVYLACIGLAGFIYLVNEALSDGSWICSDYLKVQSELQNHRFSHSLSDLHCCFKSIVAPRVLGPSTSCTTNL